MDLVSNPDATKVRLLPSFALLPTAINPRFLRPSKIIVTTDHTDKYGRSKIKKLCTLPLTGANCVSRIITNLCVFDVDRANGVLTLVELADGVTVDEVKEKTEAEFEVPSVVGRMEED